MPTLTTISRRDTRGNAGGNVPGAMPAPTKRRVAPRRPEQPELQESGVVRPFLRRWLTAAMLLTAAVLATLYISNAIAVNGLMSDIASLEHDRDIARGDNEKLRAELLKLMAVERVTAIAAGKLGMVQPAQPPMALAPGMRAETPARDPAHDSSTVR